MKKVYIIILLLLTGLFVNAQSSEPIRHHIIIALDKAGCEEWIGDEEVGDGIYRLLNKRLHNLQKTELRPGESPRCLFINGDYLSIVGFKINETQHDMSVYALPMKSGNSKMVYKQITPEQTFEITTEIWSKIANQDNNYGSRPYSLVSVAKAYALSALQSNGQQVGRTFAILVSDKHYNGNNFYNEIQAFYLKQKELGLNTIVTPQKILEQCYKVEQNYVIKYISTIEIWHGNIHSPKGYIELYEYVPLQQNFTLTSAINFPTHLKAVRQRGGYRIEMPLAWTNNDAYRFQQLDVFPTLSDNVAYQTPSEALSINHLADTIVSFNLSSDKSVKNIQLRAWLNLHDGFYNATLMSPHEESPLELGRDGLNTLVPIEYEEDATIWGMKMPDIMWFPFVNSQYTAADIWSYYIPIFLLILLAIKISRPQYYKAKAEDFKVGCKE